MEALITILVVGFIFYIIVKSSTKSTKKSTYQTPNKVDFPFEIKVKTSFGSDGSFENEEKFGPIKQLENNNWILNPGAPFELTVLNADKNTAQKIRSILDNEEIPDYRKDDMLLGIFASHNLMIKEIEEYKKKYKEQYLTKIEELKNNSSEWEIIGEKDRADLLIEFRQIAIKGIYERANCDLVVLFEYEPKDITIDDDIINEYGFENIQTYLHYADNLDKIRVIPNDNYSRPKFEKLAELGLANRGSELSKEEILSTLTLKELNIIANNPDKEYKRKNQVIEYIFTLDDIEQRIGKQVSLRELFKLNPLPEKYNSLDIHTISRTWNYHSQEVKLLMDTYRKSFYSWLNLKDIEYVKGYRVEPLDTEDPCPCAKERSTKTYSKNNPPKVPCHVGCNCFLNKKYNF
jgi:hypothetical protein